MNTTIATSGPLSQREAHVGDDVRPAPALVVASGKDHNEYENTSRRVATLMPNAQLLELPHVKHWPHFEDPETFNRASLGFLLG